MKYMLGFFLFLSVFLLAEKCEYKYIDNDRVVKLSFEVKDRFGCEYDFRNIERYSNEMNLSFELEKKPNPKRILKYIEGEKEILFDVFAYSAPETDKVRDIVVANDNNILALLHGYVAFIDTAKNTVEVSSAFYRISLYKIYKNFLLKIYVTNKDFVGIDGFYHGEYLRFSYKSHNAFLKKIRNIKITDKLILNSLETFLKPNYKNKYDSEFTLKDSTFGNDTLKDILKDIPITIKRLTQYNNIAYYLQKAGANKEAIYLLEKIVAKFPQRTVAYYNLGDAYWELGEKEKAIESYSKYVEQMKKRGKEKKVPGEVLKRVEQK
ncbi:MAG: tetratricopeptide repeat protein [Sulfurovum sp.]|nr:tetratricopeptide repeat protein [Sulfurovum sp.]